MNINWRVQPDEILDATEYERVISALRLSGINDGAAIDSYKMGEGGPYLNSIFFVNSHYAMEVLLVGSELNFDIARADSVTNYRIKIGKTTVAGAIRAARAEEGSWASTDESPDGTQEAAVVHYVEISLNHTEGLRSKINYFGAGGEDWLQHALKAYPISKLLD